jgi:response regulator RpfG family c-di-GMP phosphodiesterase
MPSSINRKVLFVDDSRNLLDLYADSFSNHFEVDTAASADAGLQVLYTKGPFAVVVADRQMPDADGIQFLAKVKERFPDTVKIMLTGCAELESTIHAVNQANLFRFLTKPAESHVLRKALEDAIRQHQLLLSERELLEQTLTGAIDVLMDMLSMVDPDSFTRAQELRRRITPVARAIGVKNIWELEVAAQLSQISYLTIPRDLVHRGLAGALLGERERDIFHRLPAVARKLVMHIPRLEGVAEIIYYHQNHFDGSGFPEENRSGQGIPIGARILHALGDLLQLENEGINPLEALHVMAMRRGEYDPAILAVLARQMKEDLLTPRVAHISAKHLRVGHHLHSAIETTDGILLLNPGQTITAATLEKINNFMLLVGLKEPITVQISDAEAELEQIESGEIRDGEIENEQLANQ